LVNIISILIAFIIGWFCATKSIQVGLRWQLQADAKIEPTLSNPIVTQKKVDDINNYSKEQINEWMHGEAGAN